MLSGVTWPLLVNEIRRNKVNHTFGMVRDGGAKAHQGWDFKAAVGTPCYAIADGTIEFVRNQGDYGMQVCLKFTADGKTRYAFYAHLQSVSVSKGDEVLLDDQIANTGTSGNAAGQAEIDHHLHFEIRTIASPGFGLAGRVSPLTVFERCPLSGPIPG